MVALSSGGQCWATFLDGRSHTETLVKVSVLIRVTWLSGTKYMYFNADELCYTPEHFQTMCAAAAGLIVYIAGNWQETTAPAFWVDV
eukprot:scaffold75619_cov18-Tisochrysis_lutea.AAC.1